MSRTTYAPKETYTGTGSLDTYTFDFKITDKTQLLVIEVDDSGVETQRVLGDDVTYLSSVTFDSVDGGGTVVLAANLTNNYNLIFLLADDAPVQSYEFRNKTSFTLRAFENALDAISGAVQRLAYRGKQALRIHDLDDEETFEAQLPPGVATSGNKVIQVNSAGTGMTYGPTAGDISNAEGYANAAAIAQAAAEAAQTAAETAETNAQTAETNAAASEVAAGLSETAAAASEAAAQTAETNAQTAETAAAASETNAAASEVAAGLSETAAAASETNAAASEVAAGLSETAAAASETNAAASEAAAAAANLENIPVVVATQSIAASGQIALTANKNFQFLKVEGSGAARVASTTPFSTTPTNNIEVSLIGKSDTNTLTITNNDAAGGCLINGPTLILGLNDIVNFIYDTVGDRYIELSRNF